MRNDFTPIETREIDDAELDNVSGGGFQLLSPTITVAPIVPPSLPPLSPPLSPPTSPPPSPPASKPPWRHPRLRLTTAFPDLRYTDYQYGWPWARTSVSGAHGRCRPTAVCASRRLCYGHLLLRRPR